MILKEADLITIHLPKTTETIDYGAREFSLMKDGVRIEMRLVAELLMRMIWRAIKVEKLQARDLMFLLRTLHG